MSALVVSDLHLSAKARDAYRFGAMSVIADLAVENDVKELIILGDLTEEKDYHSAVLVNDLVDIVYSFAQICEVYILMGNHDYTSADCPFFHFLRRIRRVKWFTTVSRIDLSIGDCLFLPHTRDHEKDWAKLPHLAEIGFVFAHNTFEGATTEHGKQLNGIKPDIFEETRVISGDIHAPQTFGPVTYVGSPYTVDFGDDFEPRVLLINSTVDRTRPPKIDVVQSIPLVGPQKRLIELSKSRLIPQGDPGDIVKVRYKLSSKEKDKWPEIKAKIKEDCEAAGLLVHMIQPITDEKLQSVRVARVESKSDEKIVADFSKQLKVSKETLAAGMRFLKEA